MELVNPDIGLVFWFTVAILLLIVLLKMFAWGPILAAINERNNAIDKAMSAAEQAREQVAKMKADNERIIQEAKIEKEAILKQAKEASDKIIAASKEQATIEANKIIAEANKQVLYDRQLALQEMKSQVAEYAVGIAEKILIEQMQNNGKQEEYLNNLVKDIELN